MASAETSDLISWEQFERAYLASAKSERTLAALPSDGPPLALPWSSKHGERCNLPLRLPEHRSIELSIDIPSKSRGFALALQSSAATTQKVAAEHTFLHMHAQFGTTARPRMSFNENVHGWSTPVELCFAGERHMILVSRLRGQWTDMPLHYEEAEDAGMLTVDPSRHITLPLTKEAEHTLKNIPRFITLLYADGRKDDSTTWQTFVPSDEDGFRALTVFLRTCGGSTVWWMHQDDVNEDDAQIPAHKIASPSAPTVPLLSTTFMQPVAAEFTLPTPVNGHARRTQLGDATWDRIASFVASLHDVQADTDVVMDIDAGCGISTCALMKHFHNVRALACGTAIDDLTHNVRLCHALRASSWTPHVATDDDDAMRDHLADAAVCVVHPPWFGDSHATQSRKGGVNYRGIYDRIDQAAQHILEDGSERTKYVVVVLPPEHGHGMCVDLFKTVRSCYRDKLHEAIPDDHRLYCWQDVTLAVLCRTASTSFLPSPPHIESTTVQLPEHQLIPRPLLPPASSSTTGERRLRWRIDIDYRETMARGERMFKADIYMKHPSDDDYVFLAEAHLHAHFDPSNMQIVLLSKDLCTHTPCLWNVTNVEFHQVTSRNEDKSPQSGGGKGRDLVGLASGEPMHHRQVVGGGGDAEYHDHDLDDDDDYYDDDDDDDYEEEEEGGG